MKDIVYQGKQSVAYSAEPLKGQFCFYCKHYDPENRPCKLNPGQKFTNMANNCKCYEKK